ISRKESESTRMEDATKDDEEELLKSFSPTPSEDSLVMISTEAKATSPISASSSTLRLDSRISTSCSSKHTVSLVFGERPNLSGSTPLGSLNSASTLCQPSSGFRKPLGKE